MSTHIGVLPIDVLHHLSASLQSPQVTKLPFLTLPHPRTNHLSLFLPYETAPAPKPPCTSNTVILEVQAVAPSEKRSWFMEEEIIADGKLLVMTPVDPVFLLIPILRLTQQSDASTGIFCPADDIFDEAARILGSQQRSDDSIHEPWADVKQFASLECTKHALRSISEFKDISGDLTVYRWSTDKVLDYLRRKASRISTTETFELSRSLTRNLAKDGLLEDGKEKLLDAGRLLASCQTLSHYLPTDLASALIASYDFEDLKTYLKNLEPEPVPVVSTKKSDATGTNTIGKKRKKEKDSHGVEQLKKVNVNGMAKISSFFKKTSA